MDCPTCKEWRPSRYWRKPQWKSWTAVTDQYTQCKYCDGEMDAPWWEQSTNPMPKGPAFPVKGPPPPPKGPPPSPKVAYLSWAVVGDEPAALRMALQVSIRSVKHPHILENFIEIWMAGHDYLHSHHSNSPSTAFALRPFLDVV